MAITKREFATKLLFWLLPWPISKALPRSLRIYYFGPAGGPPPGFYDYWGTPGEFWPDMYTPPDPEDFPEPPAGPSNPSDPYVPGPGGSNPNYPIPPAGWITALDDTYWKTEDQGVWVTDHWRFFGDFSISIRVNGEWSRGYRPSKMIIDHNFGPGLRLGLMNSGEPGWAAAVICVSGAEIELDFEGASDADITLIEHPGDETPVDFNITNIRFFS